MFCKKCGADIGDARYCPKCGEAVEEEYSRPAPMSDQRTVNKIAYALIAIFIGDFGIHRFYAGKWLSGIVYLLFFWTFIPGLIAFIEGIIALTRRDDGYGNIPVYDDKYFV